MFEPGIYEGISNADYHADKAISSTSLKKLLNATPAHFKHALDNRENSDSDALLRGSVLHAMLLEPDTLSTAFVFESHVIPDKTKLAKNGGGKEAWDALKEKAILRGLPLVKYDIYKDCIGMKESVEANPFWIEFKKEMRTELSLFNSIGDVNVRARYDAIIGDRLILDLKTTNGNLSNAEIETAIHKYRYDISAAMYVQVAASFDLPIEGFVWVFVENTAPYACRVVQCSQETLQHATKEFYNLLALYKTCLDENHWPSYDDYELPSLGLPNWFLNKNK